MEPPAAVAAAVAAVPKAFLESGARTKNFQWEKIFKIDIFVLKHVLDHSKSILTKKKFEKFSIFLVIFSIFDPKKKIFWSFFGQKIDFLIFWAEIFEFFFTHFIRIVLRSFCAIARLLRLLISSG